MFTVRNIHLFPSNNASKTPTGIDQFSKKKTKTVAISISIRLGM